MTNTEFEAIKARHDAWSTASECNDATKQCYIDRATLIAFVESVCNLADKAEAELARVREAAQPFMTEWLARNHLQSGPDIDRWLIGGSALTYGDLRRLASALKETDND